jgi:hypothetical protein
MKAMNVVIAGAGGAPSRSKGHRDHSTSALVELLRTPDPKASSPTGPQQR